MVLEKKHEKLYMGILLFLVFAGSLSVLSFISYSDGDDRFFYRYCTSMELGTYLKWRYETWTGRMIAEGWMHFFFNRNLWGWRIVNAGMLAMLPFLLTLVQKKVNASERMFLSAAAAIACYLLLDIKTLGYSCVWMTGSMNYLWPDVCGLAALCATADYLNGKKTGRLSVLALFFAVTAAMSSEQMGAVLLAFEVLTIGALIRQKKALPKMLAVQTFLTAAAFAVSGMAPGNELRVTESIETYLPQFGQLSFGERAFVLLQWLVSSFANENAFLLAALWLGAAILLARKLNGGKKFFYIGFAAAGTALVLLSKCLWKELADVGLNLSEMTECVEQIPTADALGTGKWLVLIGWLAALVLTFFLLWETAEKKAIVLFTYLGAIASEAVMILSPTIYASGERVFFLTDVMLIFLILMLLEQMPGRKRRIGYTLSLLGFGIVNFLLQAPELLALAAG